MCASLKKRNGTEPLWPGGHSPLVNFLCQSYKQPFGFITISKCLGFLEGGKRAFGARSGNFTD